MSQLRLLKRTIFCLLLAILLGLVLSGNAIAQVKARRPSQNPQSAAASTPAPNGALQTNANAQAVAKKAKGIDGTWKIQLSQKQSQDDFNQYQLTEFRLLADLRYQPLANVYFALGPKFTYTNGFLQTQEAKNANRSEWGLREASIRADIDWFETGIGALDQSTGHPALLLQDQTFPAVEFGAHSDRKNNWVFEARVETAIPTTSSMSTQAREYEKTPGYSSGSIAIIAQKMVADLKLRAGLFQYQNLPMSVATKSSLLGNTSASINSSDSEFVYDYQGSFADLATKFNITNRFAIGASTEWAQNSKAESNLSQASSHRVFSDIRATRQIDITPFYEYFRIEPDAVVALYNADHLNTNRVGYRGGLAVSYKQTLKITFSGGERDVIYTSPFQKREKTLNLKLETLDVAI